MSEPSILPDSRLTHRQDFNSVIMDWPIGDDSGRVVRVECVRLYCPSCGEFGGWCPKENTSFVFWICQKCFDKYGVPYGTIVSSDDAFREKLKAEMLEQYGRCLTAEELKVKEEENLLGDIKLLLRESPWRKPH